MQEELKLQCDSYSKDLHKCYKTFNGECDGDNCQVYRLLEELNYKERRENVLMSEVNILQQALDRIQHIILNMPKGYWGQAHVELLETIDNVKEIYNAD